MMKGSYCSPLVGAPAASGTATLCDTLALTCHRAYFQQAECWSTISPSTNGPSTCLPPGYSDAETFFRRPLAAKKCSAAVPDTGSRRTSRALWTPSPARFSAANLVRHKNKSLRDQMPGSVRKATVGAGVRGGGTKVWGGLGWSHHHLLYPPHPRHSPCARQQQHDKVKTF